MTVTAAQTTRWCRNAALVCLTTATSGAALALYGGYTRSWLAMAVGVYLAAVFAWATARLAVGSRPRTDTLAGTEAHPPTSTWTIETPFRGDWKTSGPNYGDDFDWAFERYEDALKHAPTGKVRLVRADTTHTVVAQHPEDTA